MPAGGALQSSGGDTPSPSAVNRGGKRPSCVKAGLVRSSVANSVPACAPDPTAKRDQRAGQPNVLGWAIWYLTTWGGVTKTQLSADLGTSVRNMNVHADRAEQALKERLAELAG